MDFWGAYTTFIVLLLISAAVTAAMAAWFRHLRWL
jgi:hypothetical protein